jgi:hypothetical protein
MDEYIDGMMHLVRGALIKAAKADHEVTSQFGMNQAETAEIVVLDAIEHILRASEAK